jgi:hypothetical protein
MRALIASQNGTIDSENFSEVVRMIVKIPDEGYSSFEASIREMSAGKISAVVISSTDILVPVDKRL